MNMLFIKYIALIVAFWLSGPLQIGRVNSLKTKAQKAYNDADYKTVITTYRELIDSMSVHEDEIVLNLAHAHFLSKDSSQALTGYQSLTTSRNATVRSKAYQQLGIIASNAQKFDEALLYFKEAIIAHTGNTDARYNYELLKKYLEYPEIILRQTKLLVKQRKYKEARNVLSNAMQKNDRVRNFKDFETRINNIITIDSLSNL